MVNIAKMISVLEEIVRDQSEDNMAKHTKNLSRQEKDYLLAIMDLAEDIH